MRVIQCIFGDVPDRIIPCLASVKRVYPQVEVFTFPSSPMPLYDSDLWRWQMMLENDDCLYVDWDIMLNCELAFSPNPIYPSMQYFKGQPDNCLMYSPDKRIFQEYEDERIKRKIAFTTMGWFRKILRDKPIFELKSGFTHLRTSGLKELRRQYKNVEVLNV